MIKNKKFYEITSFLQSLFDDKVELLQSVNELFELELAYLEYNCLQKSSLLDRSAYFKSVNGKHTKHFLMYNQSTKALTNNRTTNTKAYFENGLFSTGYATHGLFPYRGKFHPQLIKALINIIGIKKGEYGKKKSYYSNPASCSACLLITFIRDSFNPGSFGFSVKALL